MNYDGGKRLVFYFFDDAHDHLHSLNIIIEHICGREKPALKLVLASSKPHWNPRLKTPALFTNGTRYEMSKLSSREIESLLNILQSDADIASLVESRFLGFNRDERRRRLSERCGSDMFVCMRNIFAFEPFDDIILREYAGLKDDYQQLYKKIAGMEAAGIRVHRNL